MSVLIISPHMDDETLGAGGTILKYLAEGEDVHWLNISNAKTEYGYDRKFVDLRHAQRKQITEQMKFTTSEDFELEPANLHKYDMASTIKKISEHINDIRPGVLILPCGLDIHSDHKTVYNWCLPFTKSFRYGYIHTVLEMETISETDFIVGQNIFNPNCYVDISEYFEKKIELIKIYEDQLGEHPFPRSLTGIRNIAQLRGSVAGVKYAEAFQVLKLIKK